MCRRVCDRLLSEADALAVELGDELVAHAVRRSEVKVLRRSIQHVDGARFRIGQLNRFGHDGGQNGR